MSRRHLQIKGGVRVLLDSVSTRRLVFGLQPLGHRRGQKIVDDPRPKCGIIHSGPSYLLRVKPCRVAFVAADSVAATSETR